MDIEIYCAMCGHQMTLSVYMEKVRAKTLICEIIEPIKEKGWIIIPSKNNLDIYCSPKCAE